MSERTVSIADGKKMLPSMVVEVGINDEVVLVDLPRVGWDVPLLCPVGKSHDIFKKILIFTLFLYVLSQ